LGPRGLILAGIAAHDIGTTASSQLCVRRASD
jgi:hypothetical protein